MIFKWIQLLRDLWNHLLPLFSKLWHFFTDFKNKTLGIFTNAETLVGDVITEFNAIRDFKFDPRWNSRVVSVPKAMDVLQNQIPGLFSDFLDQVKNLISDLREKVEPEEFNLDEIEGLEKVPAKLVKASEKILGWLVMIIDCLATIEDAIASADQLVQDIKQFRETIENLDGLFLSQSNPRRTITVTERARIRGA